MAGHRTWWQRMQDRFRGNGTGPQSSGVPDSASAKTEQPSLRQPVAEVRREMTDAILGIDLGTSSTKVVIRTPFIGGGRAVAVPLNGSGRAPAKYLAPTAIVPAGDGSVEVPALGRVPPGWSSLKVAVMEHPEDPLAIARAAVYVGVIARRSKRWFLDSQRQIVGPYDLRWTWNLGIPSNGYERQSVVEGAFRTVLAAGRILAEGEGAIRLEDAAKLVSEELPADPHGDVVPEVVAEVVGYARSHFRSSGLHLLVDVGASTLDVCAFVLEQQEGDDQYALLTSLVERRGVHELHAARLAGLSALSRDLPLSDVLELDLSDPFVEIPPSISSYFRKPGRDAEAVDVDDRFADACTRQIMQCMSHVRRRRYRMSPAWAAGIPIFLAGGGSSSPLYQRAVEAASERCCKHYQGVAPLAIQRLPVPPRLEGPDLDERLFSRLAVAYGLSFDRFDIGGIVPPDQIPDEAPRMHRVRPEIIGKDQV